MSDPNQPKPPRPSPQPVVLRKATPISSAPASSPSISTARPATTGAPPSISPRPVPVIRPSVPTPPPVPDTAALARRSKSLPDEKLSEECDVDVFVASGPGGQHRNKTESGVRLVHLPTGVVVTATERRSQHENRSHALARLREKLEQLAFVPKKRRPTRKTRGSQERRLQEKKRDGNVKKQRRNKDW